MKITTKEFIRKAKQLHKVKYDYSKSVYKGSKEKVEIVCLLHGSFFQRAGDHNSNRKPQDCPNCDKSKKSNVGEFIKKAKNIHGDKYDYSWAKYIDSKTKMEIFCKKHKQFFSQNANNHLQGQGCPCGKNERIGIGNSKYNLNSFIKESKKIHKDKYDYSLVKYQEVKVNVNIFCKKHNTVFSQSPYTHLRGSGCPKCANEKVVAKTRMSLEQFISKAKKVHGNKYNYNLIKKYTNNATKVKIVCKKHLDSFFEQTPAKHLFGRGCPLCKSSDGENIVRGFLIRNKIKFKEQKTFNSCKLIKKLKFDFYLPKYNLLVEFNGIQHYEEIGFYHKGKYNFKYQQKRDQIKRDFSKDEKIKLLEIPYWDKKDIKQILKKELGL